MSSPKRVIGGMAQLVPWISSKSWSAAIIMLLCPPMKVVSYHFAPPFSLLAAYNADIVPTVKSMLQLNYPEYEVIVINDDPGTAHFPV